jgi:cob(I)alamin adenosyltransferase
MAIQKNNKKKPIASKGLTIVYVGHGKGKTTAAMGLAVRAAGAGFPVHIIQFIKGEWPCHERDFLNYFDQIRPATKTDQKKLPGRITFEVTGRGFVKILGDRKPLDVHKAAAAEGLRLALQAFKSGKYKLIVLDEIMSAVETKLLKVGDLVKLIRAKPADMHLVMTGHDLPVAIGRLADLVSEVKMIKHPYYSGVLAQRGIDY